MAGGQPEGLSHAPAIRHDGWTPVRKARFLDHLAGQGNVRAACAAVGMSAEAAYRLRRREALFAQGWDVALVLAREAAEQVLADRALHGVSEPIFYRGEQVGERVKFDGRLLLAHLARLDAAAAASEAGRLAHRFDEILALVAGARPDEALLSAEAEPALPPTRAAHADRAQEQAKRRRQWELDSEPWGEEVDADDSEDGDPEDGDPDWDDPEGDDPDGDDPDWADPVLVAGLAARAEAEAQWDEWRALARAVVNGLDDEDAQFLPGTGRGTILSSSKDGGGAGADARTLAASQTVPLHHPADGPPPRAGEECAAPVEFKSLDPVNCVNFALPPGGAAGVASRRTGGARGLRLLRG